MKGVRHKKDFYFTPEDIYEDVDRKWLNYKWVKECILHPKVFASRVFIDCFYEILLDIIHNNVTFVLPLMFGHYAEIHMQQYEGEEFKRLYKLGKFRHVDYFKSNFAGNCFMYRYVNSRKESRSRPIYVSHSLNKYITKYTEEGKQYY